MKGDYHTVDSLAFISLSLSTPMKKGCHLPKVGKVTAFFVVVFLLSLSYLVLALALDSSASIATDECFHFILEGQVEVSTDGVFQS